MLVLPVRTLQLVIFGTGPVPKPGGYPLSPLLAAAFGAYLLTQLVREIVRRRRRCRGGDRAATGPEPD